MIDSNAYLHKQFSHVLTPSQWHIVLVFLPESSLKNINILDSDIVNGATITRNPKTGIIYYIQKIEIIQYITKEMIYINSDLKGEERTHWILRSLLYKLGFTGESNDNSDSIFYTYTDNTTQLSELDLKALELMYK